MIKSHGIMFHHFYDDTHAKGQGAISANDLENIITYYKQFYNIISSEEYLHKGMNSKLKNNDVCFTFDDSLKCQYDIAVPVLKRNNLTAFWFVYTSPLVGNIEKLEIYRQFRTECFSNIEDFYHTFFKYIEKEYPKTEQNLTVFDPKYYLEEFSFYTDNDRKFRFLRDDVLGKEKYNFIMDSIICDIGYDIDAAMKKLFLNQNELKELHKDGHIVGLHSHTHPTTLNKQSYKEQEREYATNKEVLESVLNSKVKSVSYPCNSYNEDTLQIMKKLEIDLGFRANMQDGYTNILEIAREDHTNIIKIINKRDAKERKRLTM